MAVNIQKFQNGTPVSGNLVAALLLMGLTAAVTIGVFLYSVGMESGFPYGYIISWLAALGVVFALPLVYLIRTREFAFDDPLVFNTLSYFVPSFLLGGMSLATGWSKPYFLAYIQDPKDFLPYTVMIVMIGFLGLSLGYILPIGKKIGEIGDRFLPKFEFQPEAYILPAIVVLFLGIGNTLFATALGIFGYQRTAEIGVYDGLVILTTYLWMLGSFVLWTVVFRRGKFDVLNIALASFLIVMSLGKVALAGNRGGLLSALILIGFAYFLAGYRLNVKKSIVAGFLVVFVVFAGMIYGTTFRNIKGTESNIGIAEYTDNIVNTIENVGSSSSGNMLEFGMESLAERIDILSSLAVVVSNYESLAPYEAGYGLDDNIYKDTVSFFIPRVVWNDKPLASNHRQYSDLYFNYSENSFAITPMGDLIRNYGPWGVFFGMFLLGLTLRAIYRCLVDDQPINTARVALYYMLLITTSFEGFYGAILPSFVKVGIMTVAGLTIIYVGARLLGFKDLTTAK